MDEKQQIIARLNDRKTQLEQQLAEVNEQLAGVATKEVPTTETILTAILDGAYTVADPDPDDDGAEVFKTITVNIPPRYLLTDRQKRLITEILFDIEGPSVLTFNFL